MFSKILIANRGEIACRVIKTARRMGIKTVAVFSDADRDALHVQMADEAVHIGPPAAAQSYLLIDKIVEACKATGAEAVHPGYGFLSERAAFVEALDAAGIVFIGPPVRAVEAMGDKIESKKLAAQAGVNTVPGVLGVIKDTDEAVKIATDIGFPVMMKASAGGGGKGMRVAWNEKDVREGFESAMNEARSSFGDDRVFIEKFVTEPRHIEIQVIGDKAGNILYLGERECSIQRRNQKVIEEAPSPFLDAETRKAMGEQAVALSAAVGYHSAGTVEFIVDKDRNFYFLEMNTRLQVEHPVTEMITGLDLVELMIRVAAGEKLPFGQDDVRLDGWAIESRIYAEDPYRNFLPSTGRLVRYRPPAESSEGGLTVRNDTGVYEGGEVSMFYDPMIAKLVTHGPTRAAAIDHMADALDEFFIDGLGHNVPFLSAVMGQERFRKGTLTTNYIAEEFPEGFSGVELAPERVEALAAIVASLHVRALGRARHVSGQLEGHVPPVPRDWVVMRGEPGRIEAEYPVHVEPLADGFAVTLHKDGGEQRFEVRSNWRPGDPVFHGQVNGERTVAQIAPLNDGYLVSHRGASIRLQARSAREAALVRLMPYKEPPDTSKMLLCPMPGLVVSILVEEGAEVQEGEALAVVEAMKMENVLRAERKATVAAIKAAPGDSLAVDAVIMEFS